MDKAILVLTCVLGGMAAYTISVKLKKGAVLGSALVTLIGGIILPPLFGPLGSSMALLAATGSYAGMVSKDNVRSVWEMAVVGFISGILFIAAGSAYPGVGGRLGAIGAISCFSFLGFRRLFGLEGK